MEKEVTKIKSLLTTVFQKITFAENAIGCFIPHIAKTPDWSINQQHVNLLFY